jgi:hypothetical protein
MIRLIVIPRSGDKLFSLLVAKEAELRQKRRGTLYRSGPKKRGQEKWLHKKFPGWIKLQRRDDGNLAAVVRSRVTEMEWKLLTSLVGFLDRHFRSSISSMTISYERGK